MKIPVMGEDSVGDCSLLDGREAIRKTKGNQASLVLLITEQCEFLITEVIGNAKIWNTDRHKHFCDTEWCHSEAEQKPRMSFSVADWL